MAVVSPDPRCIEVCAYDDDCTMLARTVFGEARSAPPVDDAGVAWVILNRRRRVGRFPNSIRGAALQKWAFSCFNSDNPSLKAVLDPESHEPDAWGRALRVSSSVLCGRLADPTGGADHYVTRAFYLGARPTHWCKKMKVTVVLGPHVFLREKG